MSISIQEHTEQLEKALSEMEPLIDAIENISFRKKLKNRFLQAKTSVALAVKSNFQQSDVLNFQIPVITKTGIIWGGEF